MNKKKTPIRKCISCGEGKAKHELIRVVRNSDMEVKIDDTGKLNGRGAYICLNNECMDQAIKNNKLSRHLKCKVDGEIYDKLEEFVEEYQKGNKLVK